MMQQRSIPIAAMLVFFSITPAVVVAPANVADVKHLVQYVGEQTEQKLSLTARSGGTNMTGGPLTPSIVVDFAKNFNQILSVKEDEAIVQPGVFYRDFETKKVFDPNHIFNPNKKISVTWDYAKQFLATH